jgi:spore coat protein U-like protein
MKRLMLVALLAVLAAAVGFAATATAQMGVSATLLPTLAVETTNLNFGEWFVGDTDHVAPLKITVTASNSTSYDIALSAGNNFATGTRNVQNGADAVAYTINNPDNTGEWGDGVFGTTFPGTGNGLPQEYDTTGVLHTSTASAASQLGLYTDIVTVTVNY